MAINTLALATKMTTELDKAVVQKSVTGFFADNTFKAKFVGAGTVLIPEVDFSGLGDYSRDNGFVLGSNSLTNTPYVLSMERGRSFTLAYDDADETGIPGLAGQIMGEFVRTKVIPEMDAYVLSKLASLAVSRSHTITGTLATEVYKMFSNGCNEIYSIYGYDEELVAFVNSAVWAAIQSTSELTRQLVASDFKQGDVNLKVKSINGISLLPVPDSRMKTAFTFYDGTTTGQETGGFVPAGGASSVGMIIMPKSAASLVKKTEKTRMFSPEVNQQADSWKLDYHVYYDLFVKNTMKDAIQTYVY